MAQRDRRREKQGSILYDEKRGGDELGSGSDVGTNSDAAYKYLIEMGDAFNALIDRECAETCLGNSDIGARWFRVSVVRDAALENVFGCEIDGYA